MNEMKLLVATPNLKRETKSQNKITLDTNIILRTTNKRSYTFNSQKKQIVAGNRKKINLNNIKLIESKTSIKLNKKINILSLKNLPIIPKIPLINFESSSDRLKIFNKTPRIYKDERLTFNRGINKFKSSVNNENKLFNNTEYNSNRNFYDNKKNNTVKKDKFEKLLMKLKNEKKKNNGGAINDYENIIKSDIVLSERERPDPRIDFVRISKINKARPQTSYGDVNIRRKNLQSAKYKNIRNIFKNVYG